MYSEDQQEVVQNWVNAIDSQSRFLSRNTTGETILVRQNGQIVLESEDDLLLGAEAPLIQSDVRTNTDHIYEECQPLRKKDAFDSGLILRQRFADKKDGSFSSESSRHSLEQLLKKHRINPEHVLANLGFDSPINRESSGLPERFLKNPSKAHGISVENLAEVKSKVNTEQEGKLSFQSCGEEIDSSAAKEQNSQNTNATGCEINFKAFSKVAQTVTFIKRFKAKTLRQHELPLMADPVVRCSSHGRQYWSILEQENSSFLDQHGFYDNYVFVERIDDSRTHGTVSKTAWSVAKSALSKLMTDAPSVCHEASVTQRENFDLDFRPVHHIKEDAAIASMATSQDARTRITGNISGIPVRFLRQHTFGISTSIDTEENCSALNTWDDLHFDEMNNNDLPSNISCSDKCLLRNSCNLSCDDSVIIGAGEYHSNHECVDNSCDASVLTNAAAYTSGLADGENTTTERKRSKGGTSETARQLSTLLSDKEHIKLSSAKCLQKNCENSEKALMSRTMKRIKLTSQSFTAVDCDDDAMNDSADPEESCEDVYGLSKFNGSSDLIAGVYDNKEELDDSLSGHNDEGSTAYSDTSVRKLTEPIQLPLNFVRSELQMDKTAVSKNHLGPENPHLAEGSGRTYKTSLYIDSLIPTLNIPFKEERAEVMLIVRAHDCIEENKKSLLSEPERPSVYQSGRFHYKTVFDADIIKSRDEKVIVTPVRCTTVPVKIGDSDFGQCNDSGRSFMRQIDHSDNVMRSNLDVTDHQILYTMLLHSSYFSPQCTSLLNAPTEWFSSPSQSFAVCQFFVEEIKLLQQAITKYRLELNALRLRARVHYSTYETTTKTKDKLKATEVTELHSAILEEICNVNYLLSERMKYVISCMLANDCEFFVDLASLGVIGQMIELVKEQLYHSGVINGTVTAVHQCMPHAYSVNKLHCFECHELHDNVTVIFSAIMDSVVDRITTLEQKIVGWHHSSETIVSDILQKHSDALVEKMKRNA